MSPRGPLLALLLSASPAGAAEPATPACTENGFRVVEATLPNILMRELRLLPSEYAREAAAFLAAHPALELRLAFEDPAAAERWGRNALGEAGTVARYSRAPRALELAHALLHRTGGDEESFVRSRADQRALAALAASAVVHELSHARDEEKLGSLSHLVEGELAAFYRSGLFLADMFAEGAEFDRMKEVLELQRAASAVVDRGEKASPEGRAELAREAAALLPRYREAATLTRRFGVKVLCAAAESDRAFEAVVLEPYKGKIPSLFDDPAEQVRHLRAQKKEFERVLARLKALGEPPSPSADTTLALLDGDIAFWSDPERLGRARREFAADLAALRAGLARRRAAGLLSPWKVERESVRYNLEPALERLAGAK